MQFVAAHQRRKEGLTRDAQALLAAFGQEADMRADILLRRLDCVETRVTLFEKIGCSTFAKTAGPETNDEDDDDEEGRGKRAFREENDGAQVLRCLVEVLAPRNSRYGPGTRCKVLQVLSKLGSAREASWEEGNDEELDVTNMLHLRPVPQLSLDYLPNAMGRILQEDELWGNAVEQVNLFMSRPPGSAQWKLEVSVVSAALDFLARACTYSNLLSFDNELNGISLKQQDDLARLCDEVLSVFAGDQRVCACMKSLEGKLSSANAPSFSAIQPNTLSECENIVYRAVEIILQLRDKSKQVRDLQVCQLAVAYAFCKAPSKGKVQQVMLRAIRSCTKDMRSLFREWPWLGVALLDNVQDVPSGLLECLPVALVIPCVAQGWMYVLDKGGETRIAPILTRFQVDTKSSGSEKLNWLASIQSVAPRSRPDRPNMPRHRPGTTSEVSNVTGEAPRRPSFRGRSFLQAEAAGTLLTARSSVITNPAAMYIWQKPLMKVLQAWAQFPVGQDRAAMARQTAAEKVLLSYFA